MSDSVTATPVAATGPIEGTSPETQVQETQNAPEVKEPKNDFLAPKFAALTRKERQVREMEKAVRAKEAEIAKMRSEWESKSKSAQEQEAQLLSKLKSNPLKTLQELGLTFDQLTQMQLNDQNPTPEMLIERMKAELEEKYSKELNSVKETLKQKEEREAREREEAAVAGYKSELSDFIKNNAETYELIATNEAIDLMYETADEYFKQTGRVLSNEELAKAVEEHLEEQAKQILKLKKFNPAKPEPAKPEQPGKTAPTLSNTLAAEVPKSGAKLLPDEVSKREAAKLLRWNE